MIKYRASEVTCIAMTSGSKLETNVVNSGQLFLTLRRKLLAFQVKNLRGSFFMFSPDASSFSSSFFNGERVDFFAEPSFSTGWKNLFIALQSFELLTVFVAQAENSRSNYFIVLFVRKRVVEVFVQALGLFYFF